MSVRRALVAAISVATALAATVSGGGASAVTPSTAIAGLGQVGLGGEATITGRWSDVFPEDVEHCTDAGLRTDDVLAVGYRQEARLDYRSVLFAADDRALRLWAVADKPGPIQVEVYVDDELKGTVIWDDEDNCVHDRTLALGAVTPGRHDVAVVYVSDRVTPDWQPGLEDEDANLFFAGLRVEPVWSDQGPAPIAGSRYIDVKDASGNVIDGPAAGAVEAIAVDPDNPERVFVASVGGGVWRTEDASSADPSWTPLSDHLPTLSTSAIAIDPDDSATIYVGTGSFSAGCAPDGGDCPDGLPGMGLLKSEDRGDSWTVVGHELFGGQRVRSVVPVGDGIVVVATVSESADTVPDPARGGLYRSIDEGQTWHQLGESHGLADGDVSHLAVDESNRQRLFAAVPAFSGDFRGEEVFNTIAPGVYRSDDGGATWDRSGPQRRRPDRQAGELLTNDISLLDLNRTSRIELSMCCGRTVYAALYEPARFVALYRSDDLGRSWRLVSDENGVPSGMQNNNDALVHRSLLADRDNPDVVYVGARWRSGFGDIYRVDQDPTTCTSVPCWDSIVSSDANHTAPHPDSRDMVFDPGDGSILQADDGGIFRLRNPSDPTKREWFSMNGNLGTTELTAVAIDNLGNSNPADDVFLMGSQDNGSAEGSAAAGWSERHGGDGGDVAADDVSSPSIRYFSNQALVYRNDSSIAFVSNPRFALNAVDPSRVMITRTAPDVADGRLYEWTAATGLSQPDPTWTAYHLALAYGGRLAGIDHPDIAYVGTSADLFRRTVAGGPFTPTGFSRNGSYRLMDLAVDPEDYETVSVVDEDSVWVSLDAGDTWIDVTGNLVAAMARPFRDLPVAVVDAMPGQMVNAVTLIPGTPHRLLVGGVGGVYELVLTPEVLARSEAAGWTEIGVGLPEAKVREMDHDAASDLLAVATFGRGVWTLPGIADPRPFRPVTVEPILDDLLDGLGFGAAEEIDQPVFTVGRYEMELVAEFAATHAFNQVGYLDRRTGAFVMLFAGGDGGFGLIDPAPVAQFTATGAFSPAMQLFGGELVTTDPARNTNGAILTKILVDPARPDRYLIGFEDGGDGDYQDAVVVLTRIGSGPGGPAAAACEAAVDQVRSLGDVRFNDATGKLDSRRSTTRTIALDVSWPAGTYDLFAVSYDGYVGRSTDAPQTEEIWLVEFLDEFGRILDRSQPTGDIPDGLEEATWQRPVGRITLTADAGSLRVRHAAPVDEDGPINSVHPVCVSAIEVP